MSPALLGMEDKLGYLVRYLGALRLKSQIITPM
jgi:hypothetical protein